MSNYLTLISKDVSRIIYRYLYDYIPKELNNVVKRFGGYPINEHRQDQYFKLDIVTHILRSSICKIHNYKTDVSGRNINWDHNSYLNIFPYPKNNCVCTNLIKSQDTEGMWDCLFNRKHQISIINGCVYHLASMGGNSNKYNLVPYFQSDHCWQDLAIRYLRNTTLNQQPDEMDECYRKNDIQNREIQRIKRSKNTTKTSSECVIC